MIFIIDDDPIMANCIARACGQADTQIFPDAITAMDAITATDTITTTDTIATTNTITTMGTLDSHSLPELIFLDILLIGPDGFTFLNELISYTDTAHIPIVIVTSLDLQNQDLSAYNVVGILAKDQMYPEDIKAYVKKYTQ